MRRWPQPTLRKAAVPMRRPASRLPRDGVRVASQKDAQAAGSAEVRTDRSAAGGCAERARASRPQAQVQQAQAQLDQANLNLSYTKIVAPDAASSRARAWRSTRMFRRDRTC